MYRKIEFNCTLRRIEGYSINRSLADLRLDIKQLIMENVADGGTLPIFFDNEIHPFCRNSNMDANVIEQFYKSVDSKSGYSGQIFKRIFLRDLNLTPDDIKKMNFVVFTVINTTKDDSTNNPPNPPYININKLVNLAVISPEPTPANLNVELTALQKKLELYKYYEEPATKKFIDELIKPDALYKNTLKKCKKLITYIDNINATTLIGSLVSTMVISSTTYDKIPCYFDEAKLTELEKYKFNLRMTTDNNQPDIKKFNKGFDAPVTRKYLNLGLNWNNFNMTETETESSLFKVEKQYTEADVESMKQKYMKYKNKYLAKMRKY